MTTHLHFWSFLIGELSGIAIAFYWFTRSRKPQQLQHERGQDGGQERLGRSLDGPGVAYPEDGGAPPYADVQGTAGKVNVRPSRPLTRRVRTGRVVF